jgi:hypothetical protein
MILFHQNHLPFHHQPIGSQFVKIDARTDVPIRIILAIPNRDLISGVLELIHQCFNFFSLNVVYHDLDIRGLGKIILNRCFLIERIGVVLIECIGIGFV